jgi:hypothetical protein
VYIPTLNEENIDDAVDATEESNGNHGIAHDNEAFLAELGADTSEDDESEDESSSSDNDDGEETTAPIVNNNEEGLDEIGQELLAGFQEDEGSLAVRRQGSNYEHRGGWRA